MTTINDGLCVPIWQFSDIDNVYEAAFPDIFILYLDIYLAIVGETN